MPQFYITILVVVIARKYSLQGTTQGIESFCDVYYAKGVQSSDAQGMLVSKLTPPVQRYLEKTNDDQYQIRRVMRNFCKWYKYVS